jgi:hypothetical protein
MGICWYCYWGWPKASQNIFDKAVEKLGGDDSPLLFGPSHVVWEDENFCDRSIRDCLDYFGPFLERTPDRFDEFQLSVVRWSLEELLKVPEEIRCCEPEDYDEENPKNFPPPDGIEMARKR